MFIGQNTLRATSAVCATLVLAFVVTGFAGTSYRRERGNLGRLHFEQAKTLEAHSDMNAALEEYRKALLFLPDNTEYRISLATALLHAGRLDEAQSHLEQLIQEDPTNGAINLLLARVAARRNQLKEATNYYQRAVYEYWPTSAIPERRQARWELAMLMRQTGDRTGFVAELMQLYTNLPTTAVDKKIQIGFLLLQNGALSEASQIFRDLARERPQDPAVRRGSGEVYLSSGDLILARHEFQRALKLDPTDKESATTLQLVNDAIDLDPVLPNISSDERLRRSRALLTRVLHKMDNCDATKREAAEQLLVAKADQPDEVAVTLQETASQLWRDRTQTCGSTVPADPALDIIFARIGNE